MSYTLIRRFATNSGRWAILGLTLALSVGVLALRTMPAYAADKSDPTQTTGCASLDGCDGSTPSDPNIYTWDNAPGTGSGPFGSPAGYTCGYPNDLGGQYYNYPQAQMICVKPNAPVITCQRTYFLWVIPDGWDCSKP